MGWGIYAICSALILGLGLLLPVTSGENCPVNPDCSCWGSVVRCEPKCGPSVPKFAASSKLITEVIINGNRDINEILPDTFQQLSVAKLSIQFTGISDIDCDAFNGITTGLKILYLSYNYLKAVPSCSLLRVKGITELRLTGNHISNFTGDSFINTPNLQTLYLDQNEIDSIEISSFNTLNKLTYLNLDKNKISYLDGYVFEGMRSLRSLVISRNKIKSIHPKSFDGIESLGYLSLNENEIGTLDGTTFDHLVNITTLYLSINAISSLPGKIFAKSMKLSRLSLEDNQLVSLPDNIFQTTPLLSTLYMQRNNLSSISHKLFSSTPNLQTLDISENRIDNLDPETFKGINLETFKIDSNLLATVKPDVFKDCNQLSRVSMKKNRIRDLQPGAFRNLSNLRGLDISDNYLSEIRAGVFDNSTGLVELNFAANKISFIENGSLESQRYSLILNLRSNKLNNKSWIMLTPILATNKFYSLDLSHNHIGDLPMPVIDSLKTIMHVRLSNCNISYFPVNKTSYYTLDLSANNLKNTDMFVPSLLQSSLNVSHNHFQSIPLRILSPKHAISFIDAKQNKITKLDIINLSHLTFLNIFTFQLSQNVISTSIGLTTDEFDFDKIWISTLDLSYNKFNNVTSFPIKFNSSVPIYSNLYRIISLSRLNLSHNNISFVSPEAFLGRIYYLDLSHNKIQVLRRLLPVNTSPSEFKTYSLDLSNNLIHRVMPDVFSGYEKLLENINLAQNSLTEFQSLRNVLEEKGFERLSILGESRSQRVYLSDNPLNCDCESSWLRQESVVSKLDSARCDSPVSAQEYLSFCYPLENCSPNQAFNISASLLDLCENDIQIRLDDLQFTTLETFGDRLRVNVTWARYGQGKITGYRLEIRSSGNSENLMTSLVHPAAVNYIPFGLRLEMAYNVCILAQREQVTVTEVVCKSFQVEATDDNSIIISKSTLIGISSALGICVLCLVLLLLCYFIRLQKVRCGHQKDTSMEFQSSGRFQRNQREQYTGDKFSNLTDTAINQPNSRQTQDSDSSSTVQETVSNPVNNSNPRSSYEHPSTLKNEVTNSNTYETINNGGYENCSNPTEEEYSTLF